MQGENAVSRKIKNEKKGVREGGNYYQILWSAAVRLADSGEARARRRFAFGEQERKLRRMPNWPHSPTHRLNAAGTYMVTASTYRKRPFFHSQKRLTNLCEALLDLAVRYGWKLEAWVVFPNHYHFIATSPKRVSTLAKFVGHLHAVTAKEINEEDDATERKVWFQYWESHITYQRSYLARLNYVHSNAVKHGLIGRAEQYEWCSAGWFQRNAKRSFYETVMRMRTEGIRIEDDFVVRPREIE